MATMFQYNNSDGLADIDPDTGFSYNFSTPQDIFCYLNNLN